MERLRKPHVHIGPWFIYVLRDPRDNAVRYVGATTQALELRLRDHLNVKPFTTSPARFRWIIELRSLGKVPAIEITEEMAEQHTRSRALAHEARWIARMLADGADLLNTRNCATALLSPEHPGRRLRELVRARGLTEEAAGRAMGVCGGKLGKWADGQERPPSIRRFIVERWSDGQIVAADWDRFPLVPCRGRGLGKGRSPAVGAVARAA